VRIGRYVERKLEDAIKGGKPEDGSLAACRRCRGQQLGLSGPVAHVLEDQ